MAEVAVRAPLPARTPPAVAERRLSAEAFVTAEIARAGAGSIITRTAVGFIRFAVPYVPMRCCCGHDGCPGWVMVRDEPGARAYFEKLFGGVAGG